jgi:hypothetical protein
MRLLVALLCLCAILLGDPVQPPLDASGQPKKPLLALLELLEVPHNGTLTSIVEATQERWLRKSATERWQLSELYPDKKEKALALLSQIECVDAVVPMESHYRYALILGGPLERAKIRIQHLVALWEQGIRFDEVVLLTGNRTIDPNFERIDPSIKNETELMELLYKITPMPEAMRKVRVTVADAPKHADGARPNTADTVYAWLKLKPQLGSCLAVSCQPFAGYHDSVLKTYLPQEFLVETVAAAAPGKTLLAMYLDNLARWLYQENIRRGK